MTEELGEYLRRVEWEINQTVQGTKLLALQHNTVELEPGGTL